MNTDYLIAMFVERGNYPQGSPEHDALEAWRENRSLSLTKLLGIFRGELDSCSNCGKIIKKGPDFCSEDCESNHYNILRNMRG